MNRKDLLEHYQYVSLNDASFWNQCLEEFGHEKTKKMREESMQRTKQSNSNSNRVIMTISPNKSGGIFSNPFENYFNKHSEMAAWTEEDEEEFGYDIAEEARSFIRKGIEDDIHAGRFYEFHDDDITEYGPHNDPMHGGLGLGYDGEEDYDGDDW